MGCLTGSGEKLSSSNGKACQVISCCLVHARVRITNVLNQHDTAGTCVIVALSLRSIVICDCVAASSSSAIGIAISACRPRQEGGKEGEISICARASVIS